MTLRTMVIKFTVVRIVKVMACKHPQKKVMAQAYASQYFLNGIPQNLKATLRMLNTYSESFDWRATIHSASACTAQDD